MEAAVQRAPEEFGKATEPQKSDAATASLELFGWLPCKLTLEIPVTKFTVADLLRLTKGSIVETSCANTSDIPIRADKILIGWTEFEVIANRLAVRITELA
jgi:flagellar motor switch/type III secretory pathway protein FliN